MARYTISTYCCPVYSHVPYPSCRRLGQEPTLSLGLSHALGYLIIHRKLYIDLTGTVDIWPCEYLHTYLQ